MKKRDKANITNAMVSLGQSTVDPHKILEDQLELVGRCGPDEDTRKKYYNKNVSSHTKDTVELAKALQKADGSTSTTQNLIINTGKLSTKDTIEMLSKLTGELVGLGEQLGHISKGEANIIEASVKEIIPDVQGSNRMVEENGRTNEHAE